MKSPVCGTRSMAGYASVPTAPLSVGGTLVGPPRQFPPTLVRSIGVPVAVVGHVGPPANWPQILAPLPAPVVPMISAVLVRFQTTPLA